MVRIGEKLVREGIGDALSNDTSLIVRTENGRLFIIDEYNLEVLNLISTGAVRLNVKHGSTTLNSLRMVEVIANFPIEHFQKHEGYKKYWVSTSKDAFRRRFTEVSLGTPSTRLVKSLSLSDKRAYACEVLGMYLSDYFTSI